MYIHNCEYCNQTFHFEKKTQPGAHKRNCLSNPERVKILEKIKNSNPNLKQKKILNCSKCGKEYEILVSEKSFLKGNYKKNCSLKCANSRNLTDEVKDKISKTLIKKVKKEKKIVLEKRKCLSCNKFFECKKNSKKKCCNLKCAGSIGGRNSIQGLRSKNEIFFYNLCKKTFTNISNNEKFFNGWDADVILHNEKIAILWNGIWHYKKITKKHSLKQTKNRDKLKIDEIKKCGYKPYIIKDMGRYNPKFVKKQFQLFLKENNIVG